MLGRQEEIKPLGQPGQYYVSFPSTSLLLPFWIENELSFCVTIEGPCHVSHVIIRMKSHMEFKAQK